MLGVGGYFLTELTGRDRGVVCVFSVFDIGGSMYVYTHTHILIDFICFNYQKQILEPLLEDLLSQININLSCRVSARIDSGTCELFFLLKCRATTN